MHQFYGSWRNFTNKKKQLHICKMLENYKKNQILSSMYVCDAVAIILWSVLKSKFRAQRFSLL